MKGKARGKEDLEHESEKDKPLTTTMDALNNYCALPRVVLHSGSSHQRREFSGVAAVLYWVAVYRGHSY